MPYFKTNIKRLINLTGFDLHRLSPGSNPSFQLLKALNRFEVDLVLDVGANVGQFASELRSVGYQGELVSFEPLSAAHSAFSEAARRDAMWQVHPRCAIGDDEREIQINIAGNSVSSSVLPMTEAHSSACERSAYVGTERVQLCTLDAIAAQYLENPVVLFLRLIRKASNGRYSTVPERPCRTCKVCFVNSHTSPCTRDSVFGWI